MSKDWTIKPNQKKQGTSSGENEKVTSFIESYLEDKEDKKILCLADGEEFIYFMAFEKEGEEKMEAADVAVLHPTTKEYELVPDELAHDLVESYLAHISAMAEVYRHFEGG